MEDKKNNSKDEISDLKQALENFEQEKERGSVRAVSMLRSSRRLPSSTISRRCSSASRTSS